MAECTCDMKIEVTQQDIEQGRRCDPDCCPVGRALSRAGVTHLGVSGTVVVSDDGDRHASFLMLPEEVRDWILRFDECEPVNPITFELVLPRRQRGRAAAHGRVIGMGVRMAA